MPFTSNDARPWFIVWDCLRYDEVKRYRRRALADKRRLREIVDRRLRSEDIVVITYPGAPPMAQDTPG